MELPKCEQTKYFTILRDIYKIRCEKCGKLLSGTNRSNVKRHYQLIHKMNIKTKRDISDSEEEIVQTPAKKPKSYLQTAICVEIDRNKFLKCCLGMVAVNNMPFDIFDDREFFKALIRPYEHKFGTNLNSKNIVSVLESGSARIQEIITKRVKNKMISLKLDIASGMDTTLLGINIQYIKEFNIYNNYLGTVQLQKEDKAAYIKEEIVKCLKNYNIEMDQIYSTTTDNGANNPNVTKILQQLQENQSGESLECLKSNTKVANGDEYIHTYLASVWSVERCAAYSIQQAANDILKTLASEINMCRNLIKKLKEAEADLQIPPLDNATSLISTYEMLNALLDIKDFVDVVNCEMADNQIDISWEFVRNCVTAFGPLVKCAKQLQNKQYIIGDFYRDWLSCEIELEELFETTPYALTMHEAMKTKRKTFLENNAFISALYLDPRFNFGNSVMLSEEQKTQAVKHLVTTFEVIKDLEDADLRQQSDQKEFLSDNDSTNNTLDSYTEEPTTSNSAYAKLTQRIIGLAANAPRTKETARSFKQKLILLSNSKMAPLDTDILQYWKTSHFDSDFSKIIDVVLAVPVTQISAESTFSALSVVLTNTKLNRSTVNYLLLTKLNFRELNLKQAQLEFRYNLTDIVQCPTEQLQYQTENVQYGIEQEPDPIEHLQFPTENLAFNTKKYEVN